MTPYLSDKMKVLSLIAITMVIYIHTYYIEGEAYSAFSTLQRFFGGVGISGVANPLFYFISGYLFFMGMTNVSECFPKIKKRFRTLFVPYLLANTIAFAMYAALDGISHLCFYLHARNLDGNRWNNSNDRNYRYNSIQKHQGKGHCYVFMPCYLPFNLFLQRCQCL